MSHHQGMADPLAAIEAGAHHPSGFTHAEHRHPTITVAFLALVSERRAAAPDQSWGRFAGVNGDLFEPRTLERWYPPEVLASDTARRTFVLLRPGGVSE